MLLHSFYNFPLPSSLSQNFGSGLAKHCAERDSFVFGPLNIWSAVPQKLILHGTNVDSVRMDFHSVLFGLQLLFCRLCCSATLFFGEFVHV